MKDCRRVLIVFPTRKDRRLLPQFPTRKGLYSLTRHNNATHSSPQLSQRSGLYGLLIEDGKRGRSA